MQQTRFRMGIGLTPPPPTPQNQTVKKQSKAQCNLQGEEKSIPWDALADVLGEIGYTRGNNSKTWLKLIRNVFV